MFEMDPGSESSRYSGEMIDFCKQKAREHAIQYMSELAEYHLEHGLRNDPFLDGMSEELVQVFVQEFSGLFGKVPQRPSPSKSPNRPVNRRRWSTIFHFKHSEYSLCIVSMYLPGIALMNMVVHVNRQLPLYVL